MTWLILFFYPNYNPISDANMYGWCWLCRAEGHVMGEEERRGALGQENPLKVHRTGP